MPRKTKRRLIALKKWPKSSFMILVTSAGHGNYEESNGGSQVMCILARFYKRQELHSPNPKILTFTKVLLSGTCSHVRTESPLTQEHSYVHLTSFWSLRIYPLIFDQEGAQKQTVVYYQKKTLWLFGWYYSSLSWKMRRHSVELREPEGSSLCATPVIWHIWCDLLPSRKLILIYKASNGLAPSYNRDFLL